MTSGVCHGLLASRADPRKAARLASKPWHTVANRSREIHHCLGEHMPRATIIVSVDNPDEIRAVDDWFARWRDGLSHLSENERCGCCVNIWNVEGPPEAIAELPAGVCAESPWTGAGA